MSFLFDDGQLLGLKLNKPRAPLDVKNSRELFDEEDSLKEISRGNVKDTESPL